MPPQIIRGNARNANASQSKGWVVGHFISKGLCSSGGLEIKIWHYDGPIEYGVKTFKGTEFFIVERGALRVELDIPDGDGSFTSTQVVLKGNTRDYIVIPPNCKKRIVVLDAPSFGVTVRWPSAPGINQLSA